MSAATLAPTWRPAPAPWPVQGETVTVHGLDGAYFLLTGYVADEAVLFGGRPGKPAQTVRFAAELVEGHDL